MENKRKRRYREHPPWGSIASGHENDRIHDFLKGWGTVCKDGSILWDHWRPLTKREAERCIKRNKRATERLLSGETKLLIPMINATFPTLLAEDIINVQPMTAPLEKCYGKDQ
jgi:hypothetical protein